jgi:hypothetical protein
MQSDNEIRTLAFNLIQQKKEIENVIKERTKLLLEIRSLEGKINWNEFILIEYLEENNLRKIYIDKYAFTAKRKPVPEIKILKPVDDFPDQYKQSPLINKTEIVRSYHRNEMTDLEGLVEINAQRKYIKIEELENATVTYTHRKKGTKRLSDESSE